MKLFFIALVLFFNQSLYAQSPTTGQTNQQLTKSVTAIEKAIVGIKKDLKKAAKLLDNKAMLNMFQRLDEVSQDVSELRGMVEEQEHLQQRLQKRQRELYLDLDRRLREMELNASNSAAKPKEVGTPIQVPSITGIVDVPLDNTKQVSPKGEVKPKAQANNEAQETAKQVTLPTKVPSQPMSKERQEYQKAFDLLKEGRYNNAKVAFSRFLAEYPNSSYAGNAQYWSGEANYVTRQFATAMQEFKRVITQYPASNKVPDAMLKLGYTFYETRRMDSAKQILQELVKRFSDSTAARLAKKRLARMKREGL